MSMNSKNNNDFQVRHHWQLITPFKRSEIAPQHICQFSKSLNSWKYYFHWSLWPLWRRWAIGTSSIKYWGVISLFYCCSVTVVPIFPSLLSPALPTPTSYIQFSPPLLSLSMGPLYIFLDDPASSFPHYPTPASLLVTVSLFFISMSLVLFCLLVCFVDLLITGEIIWYLSFTAWLISLSKMLSRSTHAVCHKG